MHPQAVTANAPPLPGSDPLKEWQRDTDAYELLPDNASSNVLSASILVLHAHRLYGFVVNNTNASSQFILVFDTASAPTSGAVPVASFTVSGASDKAVEWVTPRKMLRGIALCNSSAADSLSAGSADCYFDVQYK